jgi:transcriptional regulator with XRE-family HTH domain
MSERVRVGPLLRTWRLRRRLSQLELALDAGVSARHLSFVETGRSRPSEHMVLHLAEQLEVPLRERNDLLLAAGYAPVYSQRAFDDPELGPVREALGLVLAGHEPYPAVVVDRGWRMIAGNRALSLLTDGAAAELLEPPVNVLRLALHPDGMARRILNLGEWRTHVLEGLGHSVAASGDAELAALHEEIAAYPGPRAQTVPGHGIFVPLRLRAEDAELSFFSTRTTFGTALDVTVAELAIESFYPADATTAAALRDHAVTAGSAHP